MTSKIITIDGPGGAGKGTISMAIANRLGWNYLDSGAFYRVLGFVATRRQILLEDETTLVKEASKLNIHFGAEHPELGVRIFIDGEEITNNVRTEKAGDIASKVAAITAVRQALIKCQRDFNKPPGLIADGRDMGTTIFPVAALKIFLTASVEERARRRYGQLINRGEGANIRALRSEIEVRDRRDFGRSASPLCPAPDAVTVDTTNMNVKSVIDVVMKLVVERKINL